MNGLVRCRGINATGCPDDALVRTGRACNECQKGGAESKPTPKPAPPRSRKSQIEGLIETANTEAVKAARAARRTGRRR